MGSKGNKVQTQSTQTYTPNPYIAAAGQQAITGAETAAQAPFQMPVAPVAGFDPMQLQAQQQIQGAQGMAQPYFGMGSMYLQGSAQPVSGENVAGFYNPMAANVTAQMQNIFGQQMRQATGQATQAAGGVGADRIGVAQANLANQQGLAAGQTYAGLYQQALQAAEQQKQMMAGAGYGIAQMGPAAQTAYLQGTGALAGSGAERQALAQAQMNAQYQNQLAQIAYPFQTPQYLAGIAGGLAPAMGGTTAGQSTTTYPTPSVLSQALGVGTSLLGFGGMGGMFGGGLGKGAGSFMGGNTGLAMGGYPGAMMGMYGGTPYPIFGKRGGRINPMADGGSTYGKLAEQIYSKSEAGDPYADSYQAGGDIQLPPFPGASVPQASGVSPIPAVGSTIPKGMSPIPYAPVRSAQRPMQLNLQHQPLTAPTLKGQESISGDVAQALKMAGMFRNRMGDSSDYMEGSARGGGVSPFDFGQPFQEGGPPMVDDPIGEDPFTAAGRNYATIPEAEQARASIGQSEANPYAMLDTSPASTADTTDTTQTRATVPDILAPTTGMAGLPDVAPALPRARPMAAGFTNPEPGTVQHDFGTPWKEAGMSPTGVGGVFMNVADESKWNPRSREFDQPRFRGTEAAYAHGLLQEGGDEWNRYQKWLAQNAPTADPYDPAIQGRFSAWNVKTNYPGVWNQMQNAKTPGEAAAAFVRGYLKPRQDLQEARASKYLSTDPNADLGEGAESARFTGYRGQGPMGAADYQMPASMRPYPGAQQRDWGQAAARSPWMALVKAGAAMATSVGPIGSVIGKGIAAGAGELEGQRKELRSEEDINQKAMHLYQQAQQHLDRYTKMTPYQQEEVQYHRDALAKMKYTPVNIEVKNERGEPETIAAGYDPQSNKYYDSSGKEVTGRLIARQSGAESATSKAHEALQVAKDRVGDYILDPNKVINEERVKRGLPPRYDLGSSRETAIPDPGEGHRISGKWYINPTTNQPDQWHGP